MSRSKHSPTSRTGKVTEPLEPARRPLPLTVQGEQGLREGEIWQVTQQRMAFWSSVRLTEGKVYEMRIDLRGHSGNVDLRVKVRRVQVGRSSGIRHGYLHHAAFKTSGSGDTERLLQVFRRLNPENAPGGLPHDDAFQASSFGRTSPEPIQARPESEGPATASEASHEPVLETRQAVRSALASFQAAGARGAGASAPVPAPESTRETGRPTGRSPAAPPQPTPKRRKRVVPQLGPGFPVPVTLDFCTGDTLRAGMRLSQKHAVLTTAPERTLAPTLQVTLHLLLPDGAFESVPARVKESTAQRCVIIARDLHPSTRATLAAALRPPGTR